MLTKDPEQRVGAWRFRLLAVAVLVALVLPRIVQRGMFVDGITYAVVARNMAIGVGTLWEPSFSTTTYPTFHEQPPLGMGLEALAFLVFGDHPAVERVFSVAIFALHALLLIGVWRCLLPKDYDSLPLFFWIVPSVVTWGVINNMLENIQALFTTLAVFCLLRGVQQTRPGVTTAWGAAAGLAVATATLVKGPVGLFPLAVPPLVLITRRHAKQGAISVLSAAALLSVAAIGAALFAWDAPRHAIMEFVRTHLIPALEGQRGLPKRPADVARHLTMGIWARMALLGALIWFVRRKHAIRRRVEPAALFFFSVGLLASLPLLISPVLAGHYFLPAVPFFALAAAALTLPAVASSPVRDGYRRLTPAFLALGLLMTSAVVLAVHGPLGRRDAELLRSLDAVSPVMPTGTTLGTCASAAVDWGLHGYLQRFFRDSLDQTGAGVGGWFLVANQSCAAPPDCRMVGEGARVQLYRCDAPARD